MAELVPNVAVHASPEIPARFEEMHVVVEVDLADGRTLSERCDGPPGIWGTPPIDDATHLAKVVDCLRTSLADHERGRFVDLARDLHRLSAAGLRALVDHAGRAAAGAPTSPSRAR